MLWTPGPCPPPWGLVCGSPAMWAFGRALGRSEYADVARTCLLVFWVGEDPGSVHASGSTPKLMDSTSTCPGLH